MARKETSIEVHVGGLSQGQQFLADLTGHAPTLIAMAQRKGAAAARTEGWRHVKQHFSLKQKQFYSNVRVTYTGAAFLGGTGYRLTEFPHTVRKKSVTVKMFRWGWNIPGGWVMPNPKAKSGGTGVWQRSYSDRHGPGKAGLGRKQYAKLPYQFRLPIEHQRGYTAARMVEFKDGTESVSERAADVFQAEFARLLDREMGK